MLVCSLSILDYLFMRSDINKSTVLSAPFNTFDLNIKVNSGKKRLYKIRLYIRITIQSLGSVTHHGHQGCIYVFDPKYGRTVILLNIITI